MDDFVNQLKGTPLFQERIKDLLIKSKDWFIKNYFLFPKGVIRDFLFWAWDEKNEYYQLFLEVSSIKQVISLSTYISIDVVNDKLWKDYSKVICHGWIQSML